MVMIMFYNKDCVTCIHWDGQDCAMEGPIKPCGDKDTQKEVANG